MRLKPLTKHYGQLTNRERFALIMAAKARGDEVEGRRLARSSPTAMFQVSAYRGYSETFSHLASLYLLQQLETGVACWRCLAFVDGERKTSQRVAKSLGLFGQQFLARQEAWRRLCEDYGIDGDYVLTVYPGFDTVRCLDEVIRPLAYTQPQATAVLRENDKDATAVTSEQIYETLKQVIDEHADDWA